MSAVLWSYFFSTTLVEPPAVNRTQLNAGHPYTTATKAWLSEKRADGVNVKATLLQVPTGAMFHLQDHQYSDRWVEFFTTGAVIDKGAYVEIPIAWDSNGPNLYNGSIVEVLFVTAIDLTTPPLTTTEPTIPPTFARVTPAAPLVTLAEAKVHLRIADTDTAHDADITPKLAAAEEQVFAKLGAAADPTWDATTAPRQVRHAVLILLDAYYERRGGDEGSEELRKALEAADALLSRYRDVSVA